MIAGIRKIIAPLAVLAVLALAACQGNSGPPRTLTPHAGTPTAAAATATYTARTLLTPMPPAVLAAPAAAVTPVDLRPTPVPGLVELRGDAPVQVWVYEDAPDSAAACASLLPYMVPAPAVGTLPAKRASCNIDATTYFNLLFRPGADGTMALARVNVLFPASGTLLRSFDPGVHSLCLDILPALISANTDPGSASTGVSCDMEPSVRGQPRDVGVKVWASVPVDSPVKTFPDDVHCWELAQYRGGPRGIAGFSVPCILN